MKYFDSSGKKKFPFSADILTQDGFKDFRKEINFLKSQGIRNNRPKQELTKQAGGAREFDFNNFDVNPDADLVLYYIRIKHNNRIFYKIGITTNSVSKRYGADYSKIDKIIYEKRVVGAIKIEKNIKEKYRESLFPLAIFNQANGATEIFDKDVLGWDG